MKPDHEPQWNWSHALVGIAMVIVLVTCGGPAGAHVIAHIHEPVTPPPSACPSTDGAINWYVSLTGSDANLGTCESPFRHVAKAVQVSKAATKEVQVWTEGGRYPRERVDNTLSFELGLTMQCWPGEVCTMDGEWRTSYFYKFKGSPGKCQNVTFDGFTFDRYVNWSILLSDPKFRSERNRRGQNWNGCNTIRDIIITRMGSAHACFLANCKGYGGITGQNSDRNLVENVTCENLRNAGNGSSIHCIYWSNGSSENVVKDTTCTNVSAACYKERDACRGNEFIDNACTNSELCFYSGMPNGRREETRCRDTVVTRMTVIGGKKWECKLRPGGKRKASNCAKVVIGAIVTPRPPAPPPQPEECTHMWWGRCIQ